MLSAGLCGRGEMVDAGVLNTLSLGSTGSSPVVRTTPGSQVFLTGTPMRR